MRIDPMLAALRRDPAPQLAAQAALEACVEGWRASPVAARTLAELERYGGGAELSDCPALASALEVPSVAHGLLAELIASFARAMKAHPLGHVPLRHQYSAGIAVQQLAVAGRASLALVCYETCSSRAETRTVCFAGGERHELCLAGAAEVRIFELVGDREGGARLACTPRRIAAGEQLCFAGGRRTKIVDAPQRRLAILRLARSEERAVPAREFRIADGALVHVASGDRAESRDEMAMAVLGALGRRDAVPAIAAVGRAGDASPHLRWQAVRHALALDTAAGFSLLTALALDPFDPLATPAGALHAHLVECHLQLAAGSAPCPA